MTKMTHEELEKRILDMLADVCGDDAVRDPSLRDADLFEEGFLDSMAAVELLLDIEDQLGVSIDRGRARPDEHAQPDHPPG